MPVTHVICLIFLLLPLCRKISGQELSDDSISSIDSVITLDKSNFDDNNDSAFTLDSAPELIKFVKAEFPDSLVSSGIEGSVIMELLVNEKGKVEDVTIISSLHPTLDTLALKAASEFIFSPGIANGQVVPVNITYEYIFTLNEILEKIGKHENISGTVLEMGTRKPVSGATVVALFPDSEKSLKRRVVVSGKDSIPAEKYLSKIGSFEGQSLEEGQIITSTDSLGNFRFYSLPQGKVGLKIIAGDFRILTDTIDAKNDEAIELLYRLKPSSYHDCEIVVYGKQEAREISRRTLKSRDAKRIAGFGGDIIKAVQALPGIARASTYSNEIIIRGADRNDNRYFIDGVEVPFLWHDFGKVSVINPAIIENIDVYNGGFDVWYGNVIGGVIDIKTRTGRMDRFHCIIDQSLFNSSILLEIPIGKKISVMGVARRDYLMPLINKVANREPKKASYFNGYYWDYSLRMDFTPNKKHSFFCNYISAKDTMYEVTQGRKDFGTRDGKSFSILSGGWDWRISDKMKNRFIFGIGPVTESQDMRYGLFNSDLSFSGYRYTARNYLKFEPHKKIDLHLGLDMQLEPREIDYKHQYSYWYNFKKIDTVFKENFDDLFGYIGGFISCEIKPNDKLSVEPQYRLDYFPELHYNGSLVPELWDYKSKKAKFRWSYEPTFRIQSRYRIFPEQTIKAAIGTYNLSPKLLAIDRYGNPNLEPARSSQYSIGYQWQISDLLSFDIQGYMNKQWDKAQDVLWKELKDDESRRIENRGKARMKGLEVFLRHDQGRFFSGWLSYTLAYSERYDYGEKKWVVFEKNVLNNLQLVTSFNLPKGNSIGMRFQYTDGYPYTPVKKVLFYDASYFRYEPEYGEKNSRKYPPFIGLDLRYEKRLIFPRSIITLYAGFERILHFLQFIEKDDGTPVYFPAEEPTYSYDYSRFRGEAAYPSVSAGFILEF